MIIKVRGLNEGENNLEYKETAKDYSVDQDIFVNELESNVKVDVLGKNYYINVSTKTKTHLQCARCLKDLEKDIDITTTMLATIDPSLNTESGEDDVEFLPPGHDKVDLKEPIRQNLELEVPMKIVCSENCKGLCYECGTNLNKSSCDCGAEEADPRWEALKKLKNK